MKYVEIRELGEIITGKTPPTENQSFYDGDYPFITPTDIESFDKKYLCSTERTLSSLGAKKVKSCKLPAKSICFVCIGSTIGKMCMTNCESYTNQQINSVIPNKRCDNDYLFYYLRYVNEYFRSIGAGTGSGKGIVNKTVFSKTKIQINEDKKEQKRIADILSTYDELIENNNKRIKILEQMAENLYKEWFVRFRFPGHETTEFENGLPKGWMVEKLGNLCEIITGKKDANEVIGVGKYPFFTCARETSLFTDEYILDANAILIAGNGSYTGFVKKHSGRFDLYQRTYALYNFKNIEWLYLYWVIKINFEREFMGGSRGSAIPYITRPNIFNYKVLVPTKDLLIKAQEFFNKVHNECVRLHKANENLIKQRDMLLPRLMSGKLEVN